MINSSKKIASSLGFFTILVKNIVSFTLMPLMILVFGKGNFGVYRIVISFTSYFMLLDMGLHNVIIRYISKYRFQKDVKSQNSFLGLIQLLYLVVSIVIFISGLILYRFIPTFFGESLSQNEIQLFFRLFIILTLNSMVLMIFNVYGGVIKAYEKFLFFKISQLVIIVVRALILFGLLKIKMSVVYVSIVDLVMNLIAGIVNVLYVRKRIKLKPNFRNIKNENIGEIFSYSFFIFINMIALQLFWSSDNIILGILTNSSLVAIYSTGTIINSYFQSFAGAFSEFLLPSAMKMVEENRTKKELTEEMVRIGRYIFIILGLIVVVFAFVGDKFIILWLGESFELAYFIALIVMVPQLFTYAQYFGAGIMWAKSKHKQRSIVMFFVAILNCFITIILVKKIGIIGAAIGTSFAYILGYLIFTTWYYHKYVGLDMILFTKELLRKIIIAYIPISFISYIIRIAFPNDNWLIFLIQCFLISIMYIILIYLIGMNIEERKILKLVLRKIKNIINL